MPRRTVILRGGRIHHQSNPTLIENVRRAKDADPDNVRVEEGVTPEPLTLEQLMKGHRPKEEDNAQD